TFISTVRFHLDVKRAATTVGRPVGVIDAHRKHALAFGGSIGRRTGFDLIPELETGDDALAHSRGRVPDGRQRRDIRAPFVARGGRPGALVLGDQVPVAGPRDANRAARSAAVDG